MTSVVIGTAANPPLASPLTFSGTIRLENAIDLAQAAGLAPATVDRGYRNAYLQSWNFNLQREVVRGLAIKAGYYGSKGTGLILRRNINQPVSGVRPYPVVSASSAILPGAPLGNVTQVESTGNSNYSALWVSASRTLARGLQFNVSYTWSKSLDYNSSARRASSFRIAMICTATVVFRTSMPASASSSTACTPCLFTAAADRRLDLCRGSPGAKRKPR